MNSIIKSCLIICIAILALKIYAQKPNLTLIQSKDGLVGLDQWSSNSVARDRNGFIWFCTMSGLNRWDGYSIKGYGKVSHKDRDLPNKKITAIAIDKYNNLWLGTEEEGIIHFDTKRERFTHLDSERLLKDSIGFSQINKLIIDKNILYIVTAFEGLYQYNIDHKIMTPYLDKNKLLDNVINTVLLTKLNKLVVLGQKGIYYEKLPHYFSYLPIDAKFYLNEIVEIEEDKFNVYCSNTKHHYVLDINKNTLSKVNNYIAEEVINAVIDKEKNLWTSYLNGVLTKENTISKKTEKFILKTKLYDNELNVGMKGIEVYDKKLYFMSLGTGAGVFDHSNSLLLPLFDPKISYLKKIGGMLYGVKEGTIYNVEKSKLNKIYQLAKSHRNDRITDFIITPDKGMYIGHIGQNGHISQFDQSGEQIGEVLNCNPPFIFSQLKNKQIVQEFQKYNYSKTILPISSIHDLYYKLSNKKLSDYKVKYFTELKNGEIWIALFNGGIIRIYDNLKKYESLPIDPNGQGKLNSNNPQYLYEHSNGSVFIATDRGINIWNPITQKCEYLKMPTDMESKHVKGMVEDKSNNLWIQLEDNLLCYDIYKVQFYSYALNDFFHSNATEARDLILDEDGSICINTYNGIFKFDPSKFLNFPPPQDVLITDLFVNRNRLYPEDEYNILTQSITSQQKIDVIYKYRNLGFSFVSIEGRAKDVTYFYRLKGYIDEWTATKEERTIHYTNLDPGNYTFEVKAKAGNGKETISTTMLSIVVQPPWYQRWYAYLLYTLLLSSLAYFTYRMRINQLLKYQSLRTKISSDLHDDVGTILTGIAMQSEMMSYDKENEDKSLLLDLSTMSRDAMERMRDIVWALDARKDSYDDLITRMREYAEMMLSKKEIRSEFDIKIGTGLNGINPEQRQNLYFIFKEAIANIVKHSDATNVKISINKSASETIMMIKDNGTRKKDKEYSGQGLNNIKMRANRIGGEAIILNEDGFCVKVTL